MFNEFASDIAGHGADCGGSSGTFEVKAGARAEFSHPESRQTSDPSSKHALLCHDFLPRKRVKPWFETSQKRAGAAQQRESPERYFRPFDFRSRCPGCGQAALIQFHLYDPANCQHALGILVPSRGQAARRMVFCDCRRSPVLVSRHFRHIGHRRSLLVSLGKRLRRAAGPKTDQLR